MEETDAKYIKQNNSHRPFKEAAHNPSWELAI